jgi:hypothetical protein
MLINPHYQICLFSAIDRLLLLLLPGRTMSDDPQLVGINSLVKRRPSANY